MHIVFLSSLCDSGFDEVDLVLTKRHSFRPSSFCFQRQQRISQRTLNKNVTATSQVVDDTIPQQQPAQ
jgi:hypothetical protein